MSSAKEVSEAFGHLMKAIHDALPKALWLVVFDETFSNPMAMQLIYLQQLICINKRDFGRVLEVCELDGGRKLRNNWHLFYKDTKSMALNLTRNNYLVREHGYSELVMRSQIITKMLLLSWMVKSELLHLIIMK
jgi:hypothetical protein